MPHSGFMISRRPIVNQRLHLAAYHLQNGDRDQQRSSVQLQSVPHARWDFAIFDDFPLERLVGKYQTLLAFSPSLLESPPPLSRQQSVILVPNSVAIDPTTLHSLMLLRAKGYSIALDNFVLTPYTESLVAYADIIGVDVKQLSSEQLTSTLEYIKLFGISLLAKNIDDYDLFEYCKTVGFDLFEGDFLTQPRLPKVPIKPNTPLADTKRTLMAMMSALHDTNAPLDKIERVLAHDRQLSQKVLSMVNSAATGIVREVESLRQAIMLIGLDKLKNIANLLILANIKDKSHELTVLALTRAHLCELLALTINSRARSDNYFTVGLVSTLDAFLDEPIAELLNSMGMQNNLAEAILNYTGTEGVLLKIVIAYEQARWELIDWTVLEGYGINADTLNRRYLESLEWVSEMMHSLGIQGER